MKLMPICVSALVLALSPPLVPRSDLDGRAVAQSIVSTGESFLHADLVLGARRADGRREVGLVLEMKNGWKTYWRNPGEAGVPPSFDWSGSRNVAGIEIDWPRPESFESFGMRTLGYSGQVVLPLTIRPVDAARPVGLDLQLALGVCMDICILEETRLAMDIAPDAPATDGGAIAQARARVPAPAATQGLTGAKCRISGAGADRAFEAELTFDRPLSNPLVVLEGPENSWFHQTEISAKGGRVGVTSQLSLADASGWIDRGDVRMTILADGFAADLKGCSAAG